MADKYLDGAGLLTVKTWLNSEFAKKSSVPTKVSEIENDSGFQTASQVEAAISSKISSAYKYKGSVATVSELPQSGNETGDVWDVQDTGVNYAWTGTTWDALGGLVDTSKLWTSESGQTNSLIAMTVEEVNTILNS